MKLKTLHETRSPSPKRSISESLLGELQKGKPDATIDDIAWFVAVSAGRSYLAGATAKDMGRIFYDGVIGLKGDQDAIDTELVDSYIDSEDDEREAYKQLLFKVKNFYDIK